MRWWGAGVIAGQVRINEEVVRELGEPRPACTDREHQGKQTNLTGLTGLAVAWCWMRWITPNPNKKTARWMISGIITLKNWDQIRFTCSEITLSLLVLHYVTVYLKENLSGDGVQTRQAGFECFARYRCDIASMTCCCNMLWYPDIHPLKLPKALICNTLLFSYQLYLDGLRDFRLFLLELCEKNIVLLSHQIS